MVLFGLLVAGSEEYIRSSRSEQEDKQEVPPRLRGISLKLLTFVLPFVFVSLFTY